MFPVCYLLAIMIYYCLFVGLAPTMVLSITVERPFDKIGLKKGDERGNR